MDGTFNAAVKALKEKKPKKKNQWERGTEPGEKKEPTPSSHTLIDYLSTPEGKSVTLGLNYVNKRRI